MMKFPSDEYPHLIIQRAGNFSVRLKLKPIILGRKKCVMMRGRRMAETISLLSKKKMISDVINLSIINNRARKLKLILPWQTTLCRFSHDARICLVFHARCSAPLCFDISELFSISTQSKEEAMMMRIFKKHTKKFGWIRPVKMRFFGEKTLPARDMSNTCSAEWRENLNGKIYRRYRLSLLDRR